MRNLLSRNLYAHVATSYHDAVAGLDNVIQIFNTLCVLDLCDDLDGRTSLI